MWSVHRCSVFRALMLGLVLTGSASAGESTPPAAIEWIREHAIPLKTVEAGRGFQDMMPLKKIVGDAQIVALGEATHGTREFFQLKHRMLEFLASKMGFSIFSIEANMPEAYRLNDYVLHGKGDPKALLKGMYFWTWNTEEVLAMIEWMREFNRSGKGRIEFTGFDMQTPTVAMDIVREYVSQNDSAYLATLDSVWAQVRQVGPQRLVRAAQSTAVVDGKAVTAACQGVLAHLEQAAGDPRKRRDLDWAEQNARVVLQSVQMNTGERTRDQSMAENIKWISDHNPGAKIVVWAHNGHVAYGRPGLDPMGGHLRRMFGTKVVNFGFAFDQGAFQAVEAGKLRDFTVDPAPEGSLDHALAATGLPLLALDLRRAPTDGVVADWLRAPHPSRNVGAMYSPAFGSQFFTMMQALQMFDALLFVAKTTAARKVTASPS